MTDSTHRLSSCEIKLSNELHAMIAEFKAFRDLMDERDRRYDERDKRYDGQFTAARTAVDAALAAQKELTNAAFASSEKAIVKAEEAQHSYNERTNELRGTLDDQARMLLPRAEADARFLGFDEKIEEVKKAIASLRESQSTGTGKDLAVAAAAITSRWIIGLTIASGLSLVGTALTIAIFMFKGVT